MINFLAEIAERFDTVILPTPSVTDKRFNIYEIDIDGRPEESFWLDYRDMNDTNEAVNPYYDTFTGTQIMLYYGQYLRPQLNMEDLLTTPYSMFITVRNGRRKCLINITRHPWLWPEYSTSFEHVIPFLSNALNPENPSNNIVRETNARVLLDVPSFTVRLSDNIAGITLNQGFSITMFNNNGFFDDERRTNLFNTPLYLKKSFAENPRYEDFKMIRDGLVENTNTDFNRITIDAADKFRALENPACKTINEGHLGYEVDEGAANRPIPLVFGTVKMSLVRINNNQYMTAENAGEVLKVFDRNGETLDNAEFNPGTKILTVPDRPRLNDEGEVMTDAEGNIRYETPVVSEALIKGNQNNRIGEIIKWLFEYRANIFFNETNFNTAEWNGYTDNSFRVNMQIARGNVRNAVEDVLKNDAVFLTQQTDGRFALRSYQNRNGYPVREIPSWVITGKPERDFSRAQRNYFNSCIIEYADDNGEVLSELYNRRAGDAERIYRRRVRKTFNTRLADKDDAIRLAETLSDRYTGMKQVVKLAVGINTAEFQLLDRVKIDININDRKFSGPEEYIIISINHAQDILELEQI